MTVGFGDGDDDDQLTFHICLPFLFSIYVCIEGFFRCKACKFGIAIHNTSIWFYPLTYTMDHSHDDPWYRQNYSWSFPWEWNWYSTEILEHKANLPGLAETCWMEKRGDRKKGFARDPHRETSEEANSGVYDYRYVRKNGEVQERKATVYVDRMVWRMKWWPILPFCKSRTCINIRFNEEIGEGTGSWKGGCTGCGYEMLFGETPLECLQRMERERKFSR